MPAPITAIFCDIDDFFKSLDDIHTKKILPNPKRKCVRQSKLSLSEIATICVLFHLGNFRNFKAFCTDYVCTDLCTYFPNLVSYTRFVEYKHIIPYLFLFLQAHCGQETEHYFVDSTKLLECHNRPIYRHKTFNGIAQRGRSSVGWFYGFKLHLVINEHGEIMSFIITPGNVDDRKPLLHLFKKSTGTGFGDRGYLGKKWAEKPKEIGVKFITSMKKNIKNTPKLNKRNMLYLSVEL